jgi:hypothetical protein|tara:strand:+ start:1809 stop:1943 length:135 start_codon:yes stop_codon:yes gene_type:complete
VSEERPFLQIPLPSEEEHRLFEEWAKRKKKEAEDEDEHIIIIDI